LADDVEKDFDDVTGIDVCDVTGIDFLELTLLARGDEDEDDDK
jgi:hypothetical protein